LLATLPGDYQMVVNNPNSGCRDSSAIVSVVLFPQPQVSISTVDSTTQCAGDVVNLVANTSDPNLSFQWLRNGVPITGTTTPNVLAGLSGNYQAVVTNNDGCRDTSNTITVTILTRPSAAIIQSGPFDLCEGEPLTLRVPNQPNVQYQWFRNGFDLAGANNFELSVNQPGTYHCVVTHQNGCGAISQDVVVNFRPRPASPSISQLNPVCFGDVIQLEAALQNGVSYQWRGPINFSSNQRNPVIPNANPTRSGWYYCTITQNGCTSLADSIFVLVYPAIPNFTISGKTRLCTGNTLSLTADSIPGATYSWIDPNGTAYNGRQFTITESWLSDSGTYTLNLLVNGCVVPPKSVEVTVNDHNFFFPTAFTPNGDGLNELFKPATFYSGPYDLRIYDRWGQLIFQSNDPAAAWDGTVFGGPGEAGAYNYVLYFQGCVRQDEFISGTVLLVR
jgi:gliding motility-associated-like protein